MLSTLFSSPISFILSIIGLVLAITIHEYSHAFAADRLGDPTPRSQDRLSLDPRRHLDPLGSLMLLLAGFGWGKPVIFDPYNLQQPRRDAALISLAGPVSNVLLATTISIIGKLVLPPYFYPILIPIIIINLSLAIFNLIPIHPLDGAKIVTGILPRDLAYEWESIMNRYGTLLLIFLILPSFSGRSAANLLISPIINFFARLIIF